jgi:hypothetical protein
VSIYAPVHGARAATFANHQSSEAMEIRTKKELPRDQICEKEKKN